jgi:hypothetical protein
MLTDLIPQGQAGCYVLALGSGQSPRYIGWQETGSMLRFVPPILVRDNPHWFTMKYYQAEKELIAFDTIAESFRKMRFPGASHVSRIFGIDDMLWIYTGNVYVTKTVDIWVLQNYESEVWDLKYQIELPVAEIMRRFEGHDYRWDVKVASGHGDLLLLDLGGQLMHHVDRHGKFVSSFPYGRPGLCFYDFWLKQTLVSHAFFMALEGYVVSNCPFNLTDVE